MRAPQRPSRRAQDQRRRMSRMPRARRAPYARRGNGNPNVAPTVRAPPGTRADASAARRRGASANGGKRHQQFCRSGASGWYALSASRRAPHVTLRRLRRAQKIMRRAADYTARASISRAPRHVTSLSERRPSLHRIPARTARRPHPSTALLNSALSALRHLCICSLPSSPKPSAMQSTALVATRNHDCHQPTCLRLSFRLDAVRRRQHCIQLSVPSQHISVQTEQTSFLSFATALPVPLCPPSTSITLRLLNRHNILAAIPLTYSKLCSSPHHEFKTPHAIIHVLAAPHTPELATLRATFRVSSRGILNAARLSVIGDCVVSLRYLWNGVWVQFYRSGTPQERHAGGELLSYGPEHGADTHIRIEAFRMTNTRVHLVASVDTTLQHLLKIDRQLPLLKDFASKGFVKTRDAQVDKCTARVNLDVFLYARQPDTGLPLPLIETDTKSETKPLHQSIPRSVPMTEFDFKQASQMYDFHASGLRGFFRGLFSVRRRRKLEQAALMIARAVENDASTNHSNRKPQLRF